MSKSNNNPKPSSSKAISPNDDEPPSQRRLDRVGRGTNSQLSSPQTTEPKSRKAKRKAAKGKPSLKPLKKRLLEESEPENDSEDFSDGPGDDLTDARKELHQPAEDEYSDFSADRDRDAPSPTPEENNEHQDPLHHTTKDDDSTADSYFAPRVPHGVPPFQTTRARYSPMHSDQVQFNDISNHEVHRNQAVTLKVFIAPWRRLYVLFHLRGNANDGPPEFTIRDNEYDEDPQTLHILTLELLHRDQQMGQGSASTRSFWFMALSVLHEAFCGPSDMNAHFYERPEWLRRGILQSAHALPHVYALGDRVCSSKLRPSTVGLISPSRYEDFFDGLGIDNLSLLPWSNPDPNVRPSSPTVHLNTAMEMSLENPHSLAYLWWADMVYRLTTRVNDIWSGEISPYTVCMQMQMRSVNAPYDFDAYTLNERLHLLPPLTPQYLVHEILHWYITVNDFWVLRAEVATRTIDSSNLLRLLLGWADEQFPPARTSIEQLQALLSAVPQNQTGVNRQLLLADEDLYFVFMLPYQYLASWAERSPYFAVLYDLEQFRKADRAEQRQYALGLAYYHRIFTDPNFVLNLETWLFRLILQGGGVRPAKPDGPQFDETQVIVAVPYGFTNSLKNLNAPTIHFLDEIEWCKDHQQFQRFLPVRNLTHELRVARIQALAVLPHTELRTEPFVIDFFPPRRMDEILLPIQGLEQALIHVRDFNLQTRRGLARQAANTIVTTQRPGQPPGNVTITYGVSADPYRDNILRRPNYGEQSSVTIDLSESPQRASPAMSRSSARDTPRHDHLQAMATLRARTGTFNLDLTTPEETRPALDLNLLEFLHCLGTLEWSGPHEDLFARKFTRNVERAHFALSTRAGEKRVYARHPQEVGPFPSTLTWPYLRTCQMATYTVGRSSDGTVDLVFTDHYYIPAGEEGFDWPGNFYNFPCSSPYYTYRLRLERGPTEVPGYINSTSPSPYDTPGPSTQQPDNTPHQRSSSSAAARVTSRNSLPLSLQSAPPQSHTALTSQPGRLPLDKVLRLNGAEQPADSRSHKKRKHRRHHKSSKHRRRRDRSSSSESSDADNSSSSSSDSDSGGNNKKNFQSYTDSAGFVVCDRKGATQERVTATTAMRTLISDAARLSKIFAKKGNQISLWTVTNMFNGCKDEWLRMFKNLPNNSLPSTALLLPAVVFLAWFAAREQNRVLAEKVMFFIIECMSSGDSDIVRLSHYLPITRVRELTNNELATWQDYLLALHGLEDTYGFFYGEAYRAVFHEIHQFAVMTQLGAMLSLTYLEYWTLRLLARIHAAARDPTQLYTAIDRRTYPVPFVPYNFSAEQWSQLIRNEFFASIFELTLQESDMFERSRSTAWNTQISFPHPTGKFGDATKSQGKPASSQPAPQKAPAAAAPAPVVAKAPPAKAAKKSAAGAPSPTAKRAAGSTDTSTTRTPLESRICCRGLCHEWGLSLRATKTYPAGVPNACSTECSYKHLSQLAAGTTKASVVAQVKRTVEKLLDPDQLRTFLERVQADPRLA